MTGPQLHALGKKQVQPFPAWEESHTHEVGGPWGGALSGTSLLPQHQKQTHTNPTQLRDWQHPEPHVHSWVKAHTGQDVQHTWSSTYPLPHHWLLLGPQGHTRRHSGRRWDSLSHLAGSFSSSVIWETHSLRKVYTPSKKMVIIQVPWLECVTSY